MSTKIQILKTFYKLCSVLMVFSVNYTSAFQGFFGGVQLG